MNREFIFTDKDFRALKELVNHHTGISMSDAKRELLYSRLTRRLRKLNIKEFSTYCKLLQNDADGNEITHFTNAVTTNLTSFFREPHHFEFLKKYLIPDLVSKKTNNRYRFWSAGCSTGEEPYSIAMTLMESIPLKNSTDIKILATDLDSSVLDVAQNGAYPRERLIPVYPHVVNKWFRKKKDGQSNLMHVVPELQNIIIFRQLNLMCNWPMTGPFDAIFCRNVVIYFDKPTQKKLINRFADLLDNDGHLFLGHSESLFNLTDRFELVNQTMYRKIK